MLRLNLKVVGNHRCRCNNSSPRYMRENHYAILASNLKISYVFKYKISITLLLFSYVLERIASIHLQKYRILLKSNQILLN